MPAPRLDGGGADAGTVPVADTTPLPLTRPLQDDNATSAVDDGPVDTSRGSVLWVEQLLSENGAGRAVGAFDDGSVVIAGVYFDRLTLDPDATQPVELTRPDSSDSRVFLAKYDAEQRLVWVRDTEIAGNAFANSVAVLDDGSVVVVGSFADADITFGLGEPNETTLVNAGGSDGFIARFRADGDLLWVGAGASPDDEAFGEVEVLPDGSLVVVGNDVEQPESHPTRFGGGQEGETVIDSRGGFVARYSVDGELIWARATGAATAWDVEATRDGGILVLGYFFGEATMGRDEPSEITFTTVGDRDTVLARFEPDGRMTWARAFGEAASNDQPTDMAAAPDGSIWMSTGSAIDVDDTRRYLSSLLHLRPDGEPDWLHVAEGSLTHRGEMVALSDGSCVIASRLEGEVTLELPGEGPVRFSDDGQANILLRRYLPSGTLLWARRGGGVGRDQDAVDGIDVFPDDSVVIVGGLFTGEVVFGEGEPDEIRFEVEGNRSPYFAKFLP